MRFYNENPDLLDSKSKEALDKLNEVRNIQVQNIDKLLDRGMKIEVAMQKASELSRYSITYRNKAKKFNRLMKRRVLFYGIGGVLILLVLILVILWAAGAF